MKLKKSFFCLGFVLSAILFNNSYANSNELLHIEDNCDKIENYNNNYKDDYLKNKDYPSIKIVKEEGKDFLVINNKKVDKGSDKPIFSYRYKDWNFFYTIRSSWNSFYNYKYQVVGPNWKKSIEGSDIQGKFLNNWVFIYSIKINNEYKLFKNIDENISDSLYLDSNNRQGNFFKFIEIANASNGNYGEIKTYWMLNSGEIVFITSPKTYKVGEKDDVITDFNFYYENDKSLFSYNFLTRNDKKYLMINNHSKIELPKEIVDLKSGSIQIVNYEWYYKILFISYTKDWTNKLFWYDVKKIDYSFISPNVQEIVNFWNKRFWNYVVLKDGIYYISSNETDNTGDLLKNGEKIWSIEKPNLDIIWYNLNWKDYILTKTEKGTNWWNLYKVYINGEFKDNITITWVNWIQNKEKFLIENGSIWFVCDKNKIFNKIKLFSNEIKKDEVVETDNYKWEFINAKIYTLLETQFKIDLKKYTKEEVELAAKYVYKLWFNNYSLKELKDSNNIAIYFDYVWSIGSSLERGTYKKEIKKNIEIENKIIYKKEVESIINKIKKENNLEDKKNNLKKSFWNKIKSMNEKNIVALINKVDALILKFYKNDKLKIEKKEQINIILISFREMILETYWK